MIKSGISLSEAKDVIIGLKNREVAVRINLGRNKELSYNGVLTETYPALFTVRPFDKDFKGKTSYSYSEYLCGRVTIKAI